MASPAPAPEQDLSDLAEVVLTKLEQTGIKDAHPIVVQFSARVSNGRAMDQAYTKVERVWLNGSVHWRLSSAEHGLMEKFPPKVLPVVQDPRTAVRFAMGQARMLRIPRKDDTVLVQMTLIAGLSRSVLWTGNISYDEVMNSRQTLATELEMVRVLQEVERVRMVPT